MDDDNSPTRRLILEAGSLVILHPDGPAGGFPMVVPVDSVSDGMHWFLGSCAPIGRGEHLIVEMPIQMDARYVTRAKVAASNSETFALKIEPEWERVQQRSFIRITAHGLPVRVVRLGTSSADDAAEQDMDTVHHLVDISAGGIRFESAGDFEDDEEVICHFELPGSLCFVLPAHIVRGTRAVPDRLGKPSIAVEFTGLDENNRSQLLRWVYREQVRRHRQEKRESDDS